MISERIESRPESLTILSGVHEAVNHDSIIIVLIHGLDPVQVSSIRITPQIPKILHHYKRFIV
ncbi:MAG: hypothetical protein QOH63_503, partial [Acidobacteriota bacterium]|nr:hypothetical protein [Acidobacteriota bacterium]